MFSDGVPMGLVMMGRMSDNNDLPEGPNLVPVCTERDGRRQTTLATGK